MKPEVRANASSAWSTSWSGRAADPLAPERQIDHRVRPAADVDDRRREGLVHRDRGVAEAGDARPVAEGGGERRAEDKGDVLDRVVLVDVEVAVRLDVEIEQAVVGERPEQVVVETDPGGDVRRPLAVEPQLDRHPGLLRLASHGDAPCSRRLDGEVDPLAWS